MFAIQGLIRVDLDLQYLLLKLQIDYWIPGSPVAPVAPVSVASPASPFCLVGSESPPPLPIGTSCGVFGKYRPAQIFCYAESCGGRPKPSCKLNKLAIYILLGFFIYTFYSFDFLFITDWEISGEMMERGMAQLKVKVLEHESRHAESSCIVIGKGGSFDIRLN